MASTLRRAGLIAAATTLFAAFGAAAYAHGPGMHGHGAGMHGHRGDIEAAIARVKDKLALDTSQQLLWDNAMAATRSAREAGRAERQKVHAALQAELAKADPDLAALSGIADAAQANGQALRRQVRAEWLKLYATFTPAQKLVVRDQLAKRMERFERFRERMQERSGSRG
jgi:Spy/CpxP family protein refolding chaperone